MSAEAGRRDPCALSRSRAAADSYPGADIRRLRRCLRDAGGWSGSCASRSNRRISSRCWSGWRRAADRGARESASSRGRTIFTRSLQLANRAQARRGLADVAHQVERQSEAENNAMPPRRMEPVGGVVRHVCEWVTRSGRTARVPVHDARPAPARQLREVGRSYTCTLKEIKVCLQSIFKTQTGARSALPKPEEQHFPQCVLVA